MIRKYKFEIILTILIIAFAVIFYFLYGLILPFILGLLLAFAVNPLIMRMKRIVKSRDLANTIFLVLSTSFILLFFVLFTQYINRDFKRFSQSFSILASQNEDQLDRVGQKVKEYLGSLYDFENWENRLESQADSLFSDIKELDTSQLDTESIKTAFSDFMAMFQTGDKEAESSRPGFSFIFIFLSTILYFVLILYQFEYFDDLRKRYFGNNIRSKTKWLFDDLNKSFGRYFQLRAKIVLLLSLIYLIAFLILDMPGTLLIVGIIILLSFIPYLQYLTLLPLALGCLVLSVENEPGFLLYFAIVVGVFILASIIEEAILNPYIMERNIGMNPVIMVLALSIWGYLLGLPGMLLGIPFTSLMMIYLKRYILQAYKDELQSPVKEESTP